MRSSSAPASLLKPTTSAAKIAANFRSSNKVMTSRFHSEAIISEATTLAQWCLPWHERLQLLVGILKYGRIESRSVGCRRQLCRVRPIKLADYIRSTARQSSLTVGCEVLPKEHVYAIRFGGCRAAMSVEKFSQLNSPVASENFLAPPVQRALRQPFHIWSVTTSAPLHVDFEVRLGPSDRRARKHVRRHDERADNAPRISSHR